MLRAPLPTTLNYNLAIHSNDPFWIVQKDQASLSAVRLTTPRRPVQTGRLHGNTTNTIHGDHAVDERPLKRSARIRRCHPVGEIIAEFQAVAT